MQPPFSLLTKVGWPSSSKAPSGNLQEIATPLSVVYAEIKWALKSVMSHFSMRSFLDINSLFKAMFPDSEIANKFQMSKTEISSYIIFWRKLELEAVVTSLQKDVESYSIQAGEKEDLMEMKALLTKANSFREAVKTISLCCVLFFTYLNSNASSS